MHHDQRLPEQPGGHMHWAWHLYDSADMVPVQTPGGRQVVTKHRLYQTPSGNPSYQPYVARVPGHYYHAWLPAVYGPRQPDGIRGKWIQLSKHHPQVGLMHAPGVATQLVRVLEVKADGTGRPRAHVRWIRPAEGTRLGNATVVSTRTGGNVRRTRFVRVSQPIGVQAGGLACKLFPWMKHCLPTKVCPAGTRPDQQGTCVAVGSGGRMGNPSRPRARPREMSVADDRAAHGSGLSSLRRTLRNLGSGRSRVIVDSRGVKIQERRAA